MSATSTILVHGSWADASSWSKVIPTLANHFEVTEVVADQRTDLAPQCSRYCEVGWQHFD